MADDSFQLLPDDVVLSIFNKLRDAKSLCLSMSVCRRFRSVIPLVDGIFLSLPAIHHSPPHRLHFLQILLTKPINLISKLLFKSKSKSKPNDLDLYSNSIHKQILKPFQRIRGLNIILPCNGIQKPSNSTNYLKWRAEFGRELHSCVILGAKSLKSKDENLLEPEIEPGRSSMADEDLKLRIVWMISCLLAASARHYLVREMVRESERIENVVVSDESDQGRICMSREQIEELKAKEEDETTLPSSYRTRIPALKMKMWYLERLEVSGTGKVMEGATLVVIRPAAEDGGGVAAADGFGEEMGEAARKLMESKKCCYTLEMNAF